MRVCASIRGKEGKKKSFEMDTFLSKKFISRHSSKNVVRYCRLENVVLNRTFENVGNLYLWEFFLSNCLLSSFKHKFCKSCYNNKWWIMCIIETCWLIGRRLTESATRVNNFAAGTNIYSHLVPTYQLVLSKFSILHERWLSKRLEWAFMKKQ